MIIQRLGQPERVPVPPHVAMADLSARMHPCIGPPGSRNPVFARLQPTQRLFDALLHRRLAILPLPPGKRPAPVFDFQGIARHVRRLSDAPGPGKRARPCFFSP